MRDLKEQELHFIWQHKYLIPSELHSTKGHKLEIIHPGHLNPDSGADFFNGRIKIDETEFAGNIEIHIKSSDWLKHRHQNDRNYDNIILHVVHTADVELEQNQKYNVPVLEIKNLIPSYFISGREQLFQKNKFPACTNQINEIDPFYITHWLNRMLIERLEQKSAAITLIDKQNLGDHSQTFYSLVFKSFGFKINSIPFELLARSIPLKLLARHSDNIIHVEALLFGAAGFLEGEYQDSHIRLLQNEFEFLRHKYGLIPLQSHIFKFAKTRPANFPTIRLAQLAKWLYENIELVLHPESFLNKKNNYQNFNIQLDGYWSEHIRPDETNTKLIKHMGKDAQYSLLLNTYVYFYYFLGTKLNKESYKDFALKLLEELPFEENAKTRAYNNFTMSVKNSEISQALIHMHDNYCVPKKCLMCGIGTRILNGKH